jgi:Tfp pilus assembly protein PilF
LRYRLAQVLNDLNDTEGERTALEQAVKIDPNLALAQFQLGILDSRNGDTAGAEQQFRIALAASPGYVQAWIALAATLAAESRIPDALQAVDSALRIAPDDSDALELRKKLAGAQAQR